MQANRDAYKVQRILPTGCMEIMIYQQGGSKNIISPDTVPQAFIGGNTSSYMDLLPHGGEVRYISIIFQPYGLKAFFNIPINEFYNRLTSLDELCDHTWKNLRDRLCETPDITQCVQQIELFLIRKLSIHKSYYLDRIVHAIHLIRSNPQTRIVTLANESCLTEKQFKRVFNAYTGCNPKEFIRIIRFNKALNMLFPDMISGFAQVAQTCGYSDQSHFIREFKAFSGYTPANFLTPETGFHYAP